MVDEAAGTAQLRPGDPIPPERNGGMEGFVVGECGHRVAGSEWRAGFRNCERCGDTDDEDWGCEDCGWRWPLPAAPGPDAECDNCGGRMADLAES